MFSRFRISGSLRARCAALTVLLFAVVIPVRATDSLTLAEAQRLALQRSQQLQAADHAGRAAREMAHAAGRLPDPVLSVGIKDLPIEGRDRFRTAGNPATARRIALMQEFTRADKRRARSERYLREADKAAAEKSMAAARTERETALAWLERYYLQQMLDLQEEQLQQARLEIQAADGAYRAGRGSQADVFAARAALVELEDRIADLRRRERNARTMLARWVGAAAERPLAGAPPDIDAIRLDAVTLDSQLAHHPEIAVLTRNVDIAQAEVRVADANRKPDWSAEVMLGQRPGYDNMISIGMSIPLQWDRKNRQDRELAARIAESERALAEREEALRAHIAEAQALLAEWESKRARAARLRSELLPLAQAGSAAALSTYRGGRSTLEQVLRARAAEIGAREQVLQLEMETARIWAELKYLTPAHEAGVQVDGVSQ